MGQSAGGFEFAFFPFEYIDGISVKWGSHYDIGYNNESVAIFYHIVQAISGFFLNNHREDDLQLEVSLMQEMVRIGRFGEAQLKFVLFLK